MRRLLFPIVLFCGAVLSAQASAPVHVALKTDAAVTADADGYFTLGSISDMSGGDSSQRARLRGIPVGRAPLPDQTRRLTPGDVLLKLRQAGLHPEAEVVLDGAKQISVTLTTTAAPPVDPHSPVSSSAAATAPAPPAAPVIHRGDTLTILMQDGGLSISAPCVSCDTGRVGDVIHVRRDGVPVPIKATVLDTQTVQLEL